MYMESGKSKFESVSEDLIVDVFLMMAQNIKAVIKLRCVSKLWKRLVNSCCLPKLTCKGQLAEADYGSELFLTSAIFKYPVEGGVVVVGKLRRSNGLLLHRLSSSPLMYCLSNLDATSWVLVNGPPDTEANSAVPEHEYASLLYCSQYRLYRIVVSMRVNCSSCDGYKRYLRYYHSDRGKWTDLGLRFEHQVCETCGKK